MGNRERDVLASLGSWERGTIFFFFFFSLSFNKDTLEREIPGRVLSRSYGFGPLINSLSSSLLCRLGLLAMLPCLRRDATLGCICHTVVLAEVIQAFSAPENAVRMDEARDNACNDMGKMLQFVLPVATQIQQEVIKAYGFSCDGEGGLGREGGVVVE